MGPDRSGRGQSSLVVRSGKALQNQQALRRHQESAVGQTLREETGCSNRALRQACGHYDAGSRVQTLAEETTDLKEPRVEYIAVLTKGHFGLWRHKREQVV